MKPLALLPFLLFSLFIQADQLPVLNDLESLQWKNRIVVVNEHGDLKNSEALLGQHMAEINDRDILWFVIKQDQVLNNYPGESSPNLSSSIRQRYAVEPGSVVLIGKDGGVKSRSNRLDLDTLFSEIDVMPMRQLEMQK